MSSGDRKLNSEQTLDDVCGIVSTFDGFFVTTGTDPAQHMSRQTRHHAIAWDNRIVAASTSSGVAACFVLGRTLA